MRVREPARKKPALVGQADRVRAKAHAEQRCLSVPRLEPLKSLPRREFFAAKHLSARPTEHENLAEPGQANQEKP